MLSFAALISVTMAKKENQELLENPEALKEKLAGAEHWIEDNPKIVFSILGALVLIVGGFFGYRYWVGSQDNQAQKDMFQAVRYFEADSLNLALNGDGNNLGFLSIIDDYSMTPAGKLANFYVGSIYLKQGKFKPAILYLEDFNSDDLLVQARTYSLIGDCHMELKEFEDAAKFYTKAAEYKPNKFFSPTYWMKAALAYEKLNQPAKAREVYDQVIEKYWDSNESQNARRYKAKLNTNS
jgi:tetratricopeptide (TPR) repeat protein